jgi:hypothetical protein
MPKLHCFCHIFPLGSLIMILIEINVMLICIEIIFKFGLTLLRFVFGTGTVMISFSDSLIYASEVMLILCSLAFTLLSFSVLLIHCTFHHVKNCLPLFISAITFAALSLTTLPSLFSPPMIVVVVCCLLHHPPFSLLKVKGL